MVIFHCYVKLPEGIFPDRFNLEIRHADTNFRCPSSAGRRCPGTVPEDRSRQKARRTGSVHLNIWQALNQADIPIGACHAKFLLFRSGRRKGRKECDQRGDRGKELLPEMGGMANGVAGCGRFWL